MTKAKIIRLGVITVLGIASIDLVRTWDLYSRAFVCVDNGTSSDLTGVRAGTGGADKSIGTVAPGKTACTEVYPSGEAGAVVHFTRGGKEEEWTGGYIEHTGWYTLVVVVGDKEFSAHYRAPRTILIAALKYFAKGRIKRMQGNG